VRVSSFVLRSDEMLFLPAGWAHQVETVGRGE
jgi:hypothetical protein